MGRVFESPEERERRTSRDASLERHSTFRQSGNWHRDTYSDRSVLDRLKRDNSRIVVSLRDQRGMLMKGDLVAIDFPIASGKRTHPTPTGSYTILQMARDYRSNLYGRVLDAEGNVVKRDADRRRAEIPEGGEFVGAPMPYWLRLTNTGIGLHVGDLPGRPASHGCIRMPRRAAQEVFRKVQLGTPVEVVDQFDPAQPSA